MTLYVLFNASCSICAPEAAHYQRLAQRSGADIRFENLHETDLTPWGLTSDQAMRQLHASHGAPAPDRTMAGLPAFLALWSRLPRWRWLARILRLPGLKQGTALIYGRVLAPWLYARAQRRACPLPQPRA